MSLQELMRLAPPPASPMDAGREDQWEEVERTLGTTLPQDYKRLVNRYGRGYFGNYIALANPFIHYPYLDNLVRSLPEFYRLYERGRATIPDGYPPFPAYPITGGLLPWGRDDSAGVLCWRTEGEPDTWPTIVLDGEWSEIYYEYPVTMTEFLIGWLSGEMQPDCYPPDIYPLKPPLFRLELFYEPMPDAISIWAR